MYSLSKTSYRNIPIYFNTIYRGEMKFLPFIIDYFLLHFDALKFALGVCLHLESQPNINFFNVNHQIFQRNHKVHLSNSVKTNFHNISNIRLRVIRCRNDN